MRSSSIGGCLPFEYLWFWFGPLSLSLEFEEDRISGCWDIYLFIFEVIFHWRSSFIWGPLHFNHFWFWFGPLSLSLKFKENPISGCWDIQLLIFEVIFHWRSSSLRTRRFNQWILNYSPFNILRSSSIRGHLHWKNFFILVRSPEHKFQIWDRSGQ